MIKGHLAEVCRPTASLIGFKVLHGVWAGIHWSLLCIVLGWCRSGTYSCVTEFNPYTSCSVGSVNHEEARLRTHQRRRRWTCQLLCFHLKFCLYNWYYSCSVGCTFQLDAADSSWKLKIHPSQQNKTPILCQWWFVSVTSAAGVSWNFKPRLQWKNCL